MQRGKDKDIADYLSMQHGKDKDITDSLPMQRGKDKYIADYLSMQNGKDKYIADSLPMQHGKDKYIADSLPMQRGKDKYIAVSLSMQRGKDKYIAVSLSIQRNKDKSYLFYWLELPIFVPKNKMEAIDLKIIKLEDVYVSVLDAWMESDEMGRRVWKINKRQIPPTGSFVMDAVARVLAQDIRTKPEEIAQAMNRAPRLLYSAFILLTGQSMRDFINEYQLRMICEYLTCTDVSMQEIVKRTGFYTQPALSRFFTQRMKCTPKAYRNMHRPKDFRQWYRWKK